MATSSTGRTGRTSRPRALILDIYGAFARRLGNWLAVSHLVTLLADLGVDEHAVRSAISRMKRRGLLAPSRRDGVMGYTLTDTALAILAEGDPHIYGNHEPARLDDPWALAVFSVPETQRGRRHALRTRLTRLGFGTLAPGVWIAPARLIPETEATLRRGDLTDCVDLYEARYRNFATLHDMIERAWDLDALDAMYKQFLADAEPVLDRWARAETAAFDQRRRDAFVDYIGVLHQWRRLPFLDPGLPTEVLPRDWAGTRARRVFLSLIDRIEPAAYRYVVRTGGGGKA